jgi:hypothetical protein
MLEAEKQFRNVTGYLDLPGTPSTTAEEPSYTPNSTTRRAPVTKAGESRCLRGRMHDARWVESECERQRAKSASNRDLKLQRRTLRAWRAWRCRS